MNIIEFAKFKKMFGGGGATVYTAKSRNELPIDAADGSMAIVESDSTIGKWKFNETIGEGNFSTTCRCSAKDNNGEMHVGNSIQMSSSGGETYINISVIHGKTRVLVKNIYNSTAGWAEFLQREVEMFDNSSALEFLKANATRISGGNALYIYEKGKWVYKCEIV